MLYLDTSVLAAYYCPEPASEKVEKVIRKIIQPAINHLTEVELASAVSKKIREKSLSSEDGNKILLKFESHIEGKLFQMIPVEFKHFQTAKNWISMFRTSLKTLDALHLAIAVDKNLPIFTADAHLAKSAKRLGISYKLIA